MFCRGVEQQLAALTQSSEPSTEKAAGPDDLCAVEKKLYIICEAVARLRNETTRGGDLPAAANLQDDIATIANSCVVCGQRGC